MTHSDCRRDQPIRSRNSSSALPTFCSRLVSTTVRSGLATYQALGRQLVPGDEVLHLGAADSRPSLEAGEQDVHVIRDLRREIVDVGVPVTVVGGGEQQFAVVIQEHETHVVHRADLSAPSKLPFSRSSTPRSRLAPPSTNGAITVNSDTTPCRRPTRPALPAGAECASAVMFWIAFSNATFPISGASTYSPRTSFSFCSSSEFCGVLTGLLLLDLQCVGSVMVVLPPSCRAP